MSLSPSVTQRPFSMNDERDKFSGLYNRVYGRAYLEQALAKAEQQGGSMAILLTDFDRFKAWNDTHGLFCGDIMLRQIAAVVQDAVADKGAVCRVGGDEFLIVLPDTDALEAQALAERIRQEVAQQKVEVDQARLVQAVTLTIGLAVYPQHGSDAKTLFFAADEALNQGKLKGRNTISWL